MQWPEYRNRILAEIDNEAFLLSELKNTNRRGNEIKAECPFKDLHENKTDETPSLTVNVDKGVYYCQTCHAKGNIHTLYKSLYGLSPEEAWFELGDALKIPRPDSTRPTRPDIDVGLVSYYHQALMNLTGPIRNMLSNKRGYADDTLRRFQLGWDGERVTIPVYDEFNSLVNIRRYQWNSTNDQWKLLNYKDEAGNTYGEVRIYGIENLINEAIEDIVWCEGETDRILAEQNGFPTCTPTSGAGAWMHDWARYFRNKKRVFIVQDNDEAGRIATKKLCEKLYRVVDVFVIKWPEDFPKKGDVTDFFVACKLSAEDFKKLLESAEKYIDPTQENLMKEEAETIPMHLADSSNAEHYGKRVKVPVMVSGKDSTPFLCPKTIKYHCGDIGDAKKCKSCGLALFAGETTVALSSKHKDIMKLIKCTEEKQMYVLKELVNIDPSCKRCKITVEESMNIEEVRLIPKAEVNFGFSKEHEYVVRTGYYIGNSLKTNKRYTMIGYMYPDPNTQYATYLFDKAIPEKDFISEFDMNEDIAEQLMIFRPANGQTIEDKFDEIHEDIERNVTYVWQRRDVAFAVDLIYHTVLNFYFQEQFVKRGWGELLIIGDSGQAKTTVVERIMGHYRLGELHSGESSRRTGLVYNIQQNNKRWFLVWGAFPLNDGGLITIDEVSGISEDDLAVMSDVRSSGIAKATGVITAETSARTRAIYISNPRNGRQLNTETYGVTAILKLWGKTEDVRRLDLAIAVASGDVDPSLVNIKLSDMPLLQHRYTSDLCHLRTMWSWSRKPEHIKFSKEAVDYILDKATEMGNKYTASIPIVEAADQRIKIARLAAACACCMFSTDETFENVIINKEHVEFVVNFMTKIYAYKSLGYDALSDKERVNSNATQLRLEELRKQYILLPLPDHNEMAQTLYNLSYFNRNTLEDYSGLPKDELRTLLKFLTTQNLVERVRADYRRYPLGTEFFLSILNNPILIKELNEVRKQSYSNEY